MCGPIKKVFLISERLRVALSAIERVLRAADLGRGLSYEEYQKFLGRCRRGGCRRAGHVDGSARR
ncbi:protein of unknown function [Hyphomicrobium sp. MC1]|nr:protein of unknown function [Hyphomicrobium sp. MC1]